MRNNYDNPSKYDNQKRNKKKHGEYWIYGINPVIAALNNKSRVCKRLLCTKELLSKYSNIIQESSKLRGIFIEEVTKKEINNYLEPNSRHQGIILRVKTLNESEKNLFLDNPPKNSILLALDQISDPRNVGAIIRSSLIFGCEGIIIPKNNSPQETGLLAKSASGALEEVNIYRVTNLTRELKKLKKNGFWVIGLDTEANNSISKLDISGPIVVVIGPEGSGLRRLTKEACDTSFSIDINKKAIKAGVDSLNVSSATSVALFAINQMKSYKN